VRPHRLTITAFGPYPGTQEVDFDALTGAGLFLINGPTGAGKTSVLDAVCFALYGRVPRGDARNLRSQHAPPDRAPSVVLDVTLRGRRFRITRSPRWERPKRRGTGTTEERGRARLDEWRDGAWQTWSTGFDEAGQRIGDLLGMSAEQFFQVVLLPQGEFASFLRADADRRRRVLERLFATEVFAQVEQWLTDHRALTHREATRLRAAAESVADRAAEAAGAARPDLDPAALTAWTTELSAHVADAGAALTAQTMTATTARDRARAALDHARMIAERQERHADAARRSAALTERAGERATVVATLRAAERADRVVPLLHGAATRATRREEAEATALRLRAAVADLVPDIDAALPGEAGATASTLDTAAAGLAGDAAVSGPDSDPAAADAGRACGAAVSGFAPDAGPADAAVSGLVGDAGAAAAGLVADAVAGRVRDVAVSRVARDVVAGAGAAAAGSVADAAAGRVREVAVSGSARGAAAAGFDGAAWFVPDAADAELMRKEERIRRDEVVELGQRRADAERLSVVRAEIVRGEREADELGARQAELSLFLCESPAYREIMIAELEQARALAATVPVAEATVRVVAERLEAAGRRDALTARLAEAQAGHLAATDAAQASRDAYQEIRQARLDGMAASLARELRPGEPCQVCGSPEHPSPASASRDAPGEEAEAAAEVAFERARQWREDAATQVAELTGELTAAAERAGDAGVAELRADLADVRAELAASRQALAEIERIEDDLRRVDAEADEARDRQREVDAILAGNRAHHAARTAEADRLETAVDQARGEDPTIDARVARLGREADALSDAAAALDRLHAAVEDAAEAFAEAALAAEAQGFDSPGTARAAALGADERAAMLRQVRAWDDDEARIAERLSDPGLTAAAAEPPPDLATLRAALARAEEHHQAVTSARDRFRHRGDRLAELSAELRDRAAEWRPAAERYDLAARVAALTSGDPAANHTRMRLSAYVLAARLEQVVAAANVRLARMSGDRYSLEHTVERSAAERGARHGTGGLGLRVLDAWTGLRRDPGTLSGGETFVASLALALGLADVVTAEAGGAEIGTLFVDEGFGTLDEDTLDEVMDVLDGLRDGGRAVGIVSHVAELRTRIPAQLRVRKTRTGSALTVDA
jgi:exonuclease SbcC